jgi:hypothetical protein
VIQTLEGLGLSPGGNSPGQAPDWTKLNEIARELQSVTVHLIRHERSDFFGKHRDPIDAGTYHNVPVETLQSGTAEWIFSQAGGGEYTVEVIHPTNVRMGRLTSYKINIPGDSKKPIPLAAQEAKQMLTSQAQASGLAQQLIEGGMASPQAYELARKMTENNPLSAFGLGGAEDDMAGGSDMGRFMQMQMMRDMAREERESREKIAMLAAQPLQQRPAEDVRLQALERRLEEADRRHAAEKAEWDRKEQERRVEDRFRAIDEKFNQLLQRLDKPVVAPPVMDPGVTMLSTIIPALTGMTERRAEDQARNVEMQLKMMETTLANAGKRDPALDQMLGHMLDTTRLSMEAQQLKLQEPVKNAEAMNAVFGMLGGMMQMTHQIILQQMAAQQGNPFWEKLSAIADQLPNIIMSLASPEVEHGTVESPDSETVTERAAATRVMQLREADARAKQIAASAEAETAPAQLAAEPEKEALPPATVETAPVESSAEAEGAGEEGSEEEEDNSLPDDPIERARLVLENLELTAAEALLENPDAVTVLNLFLKSGASTKVLGEKLGKLLLELETVVDVKADNLARVCRENFGWTRSRAETFVAEFTKTMHAAAAA